jgi:hypothetical protein
MESDWLPDDAVYALLGDACAGNVSALEAYVRENPLRAASADCSYLVLVRDHLALVFTSDDQDLWSDMNCPPDGGEKRQVINLYQRSGWSKIAVPLQSPVRAVAWREGCFSFDLGNRQIKATPQHLARAIGDRKTGRGLSETAIVHDFSKIEGLTPIERVAHVIDWEPVRAKLPLSLKDSVLGELTRKANDTDFECAVMHMGRSVTLTISPSESAEVTVSIERARQVITNLDAYVGKARLYAAGELLALKNDYWLDEDETDLMHDEFQAQMTLLSIWCAPDGGVTFDFSDGTSETQDGMFAGHDIVLDMEKSDEFTSADIAG